MIVVLQMGHVPRTTGATGTKAPDGVPTEQQFAKAAAAAAADELGRRGWTVRVIGADPPSASVYAGEAFVAIHCDGSTDRKTRGASVGYQTAEGRQLAEAWKAAYLRHGWAGGFKPDNYTAALGGYYGVKRAVERGNRRAFIAECGFLTNAADEALLWPDGPHRFALAVADALAPSAPPNPDPSPPGDADMHAAILNRITHLYERANRGLPDPAGLNHWYAKYVAAADSGNALQTMAVDQELRKGLGLPV